MIILYTVHPYAVMQTSRLFGDTPRDVMIQHKLVGKRFT